MFKYLTHIKNKLASALVTISQWSTWNEYFH